jgi:hypothetical protein
MVTVSWVVRLRRCLAMDRVEQAYYRLIGRLGGKRKSKKKTAATRRNLERARLARWGKKSKKKVTK